ncbi:hypothetical protein EON66_02470 [archaeon]|nr:MAG: hypothetical protein EON66_02470 [archaeon]
MSKKRAARHDAALAQSAQRGGMMAAGTEDAPPRHPPHPPAQQRGSGGALYLIGSAMVQRLLTFGLNTALLRYVSADVLGFAASDMELLLSTILFLSRESCRLVVLRTPASTLHASNKAATVALQRQAVVNLAWLPCVVGVLLALLAACAAPAFAHTAADVRVVHLFCASAAIESLAEPAYIINTALMNFKLRAKAETLGAIARIACTFFLVVFLGWRATAFAVGQLAFALIQLILHGRGVVRHAREHAASVRLFLPAPLYDTTASGGSRHAAAASGWISNTYAPLLASFTLQSVVKHVATEADRLLLSVFASREQRGAYAVVTNYGSLAARLLFQPIEEHVRAQLAQARRFSSEHDERIAAGCAHPPSSAPAQSAQVAAARHMVDVYHYFSRIVSFLGVSIAVFGLLCAPSVVPLMLGARWASTDVPRALGAYCVYIMFISLNGVAEAFAMATADASQVQRLTGSMLLSVVLSATSTWLLFPRLGIVAFIVGNSANSLLRLCYSLYSASRTLRSQAPSVSIYFPKVRAHTMSVRVCGEEGPHHMNLITRRRTLCTQCCSPLLVRLHASWCRPYLECTPLQAWRHPLRFSLRYGTAH